MPSANPKASRPKVPEYGLEPARRAADLLPWKWAVQRLTRSRTYLLSTTRPDGSPHAMPIWGIWLGSAFYFSTGRESRKARNLARNPRCVVTTDDLEELVVIEGAVEEVKDAALLKRLGRTYKTKYEYGLDPKLQPVFAVLPRVAYGLAEKKFTKTFTRWQF